MLISFMLIKKECTTVSVTEQFWLISRCKFPFFNDLSVPNTTQPDYGINSLRFPLFGFYSAEKITMEKLKK